MQKNDIENTVEEVTSPAEHDDAVKKQLLHQTKSYLAPKDYAAYILSGTGDKNWDNFSGSNSDFFNRNILGIDALTLSTASVICSFADTFDNAISGPIIDRTRTRWGRVRPYLLITLPLWLMASAVPWVLPSGLSQVAYLGILAFIWYLGSIAGSFYNPSYSALLFNLTPNVDERNKLIATDAYVDLIGGSLPSLFSPLLDFLPESISRRSIFMGGAFFFIALVVIFRSYGFFTLRERVPLASREDMNNVSVWKSLKQVARCRPMWVLLIKNLWGVGKGVSSRIEKDFWINCFGKVTYSTFAGLFTGLPSYFILPFAPKLTKKIGLKNLGSFSYLFCGISYLIMYLVGYKPTGNTIINVIWIVFALTVCGSVNCLQRYSGVALTGDLYDYVEWKTGVRNEGMLSAAMGYIGLVTNQVATILSGLIISRAGIKTEYSLSGQFVRQTNPTMLRNLWMVFALAPAIGRSLKGITLRFFNVDGEVRDKMMVDLAAARAKKTVDEGNSEQ